MSFFEALYAGTCTDCDEPISPGDLISRGDADNYTHAICPPAKPEPAKVICPGCFLELPTSGVCGVCDE